MSTVDRPEPRVLPPLADGQRLDRATFHERYEAMPPGIRAELIDGVVSMPSPVGREHARAQVPVLVWLSYYEENTPGVEALDNASTVLGPKSEPQPDAQLRILPEFGGRTENDRRFVRGVPELIVEVAHSSRYTDFGSKHDDYERVGLQEYVILALEPDEVHWYSSAQGSFAPLPPGADGILRSLVFPGLWLDPRALVARDTRRLRAVLDLGFATPEHAAFVARLEAAREAR